MKHRPHCCQPARAPSNKMARKPCLELLAVSPEWCYLQYLAKCTHVGEAIQRCSSFDFQQPQAHRSLPDPYLHVRALNQLRAVQHRWWRSKVLCRVASSGGHKVQQDPPRGFIQVYQARRAKWSPLKGDLCLQPGIWPSRIDPASPGRQQVARVLRLDSFTLYNRC